MSIEQSDGTITRAVACSCAIAAILIRIAAKKVKNFFINYTIWLIKIQICRKGSDFFSKTTRIWYKLHSQIVQIMIF